MQLSTIQLSEIERQVYEFRRSRQKDSKKCLHFLCIFILWMLFVILICSILFKISGPTFFLAAFFNDLISVSKAPIFKSNSNFNPLSCPIN